MTLPNNDELESYNKWRQQQGLSAIGKPLDTHSPPANNNDAYLDYTDWRQLNGLTLLAPKAAKRQRHLFLTDRAWLGLQHNALQHGYTYGVKGANVTAYLEALGHGLLSSTTNDSKKESQNDDMA